MRIVNGLVFCEDGAFHPLEVETQGDRIAALEPVKGRRGGDPGRAWRLCGARVCGYPHPWGHGGGF